MQVYVITASCGQLHESVRWKKLQHPLQVEWREGDGTDNNGADFDKEDVGIWEGAKQGEGKGNEESHLKGEVKTTGSYLLVITDKYAHSKWLP